MNAQLTSNSRKVMGLWFSAMLGTASFPFPPAVFDNFERSSGVSKGSKIASFWLFWTKNGLLIWLFGLLAFPRVFFSSFDKSDHKRAGGGEGEACAFKLS